jgi:hypothetical protein
MERLSMRHPEEGSVGCLTVKSKERGGSGICKDGLQKTKKIKQHF